MVYMSSATAPTLLDRICAPRQIEHVAFTESSPKIGARVSIDLPEATGVREIDIHTATLALVKSMIATASSGAKIGRDETPDFVVRAIAMRVLDEIRDDILTD